MANYEYKTEVLTSMVGRDKLRVGDLEDTLQKFGADGWELVATEAITRPLALEPLPAIFGQLGLGSCPVQVGPMLRPPLRRPRLPLARAG